MDSKRTGEITVQILVDAEDCPVVEIVESTAEKCNIPSTLLCDTNHVTIQITVKKAGGRR